jgi:hypothetical protein
LGHLQDRGSTFVVRRALLRSILSSYFRPSPWGYKVLSAGQSKYLVFLVANIKPSDPTPQESIAFDFAYALVRGGTLPEPLYRLAVKTFGQHSTNETIYLVGLYCLVSTTLNGFNVPVTERK